jgi:hypothetical protein
MGFGKRLSNAFRCFFSLLSNEGIPADILSESTKTSGDTSVRAAAATTPALAESPVLQPEKPAVESVDRALQMLALLQRDGRLIDFFSEDITPYEDAQIGAAVRDVHENCRKVLEHYLRLEPILAGEEGRPVTVESDFDPAEIKLVGNVVGKLPLRGLLRHRGWRAKEVHLPPLPSVTGRSVIAPAEVEVM